MRIIHVTEAMASGTLQVIIHLARAQVADGHRVHVIHSVRPETPEPAKLHGAFPAQVTFETLPFVTAFSPVRDAIAAAGLARSIRKFKPDVLHAHSSKAGALARLVCNWRRGPAVFYSPHGFSFQRMDVSPAKRLFFRTVERLLARVTGTIIACSQSEAQLARSELHAPRVVTVDNAIDMDEVPAWKGGSGGAVTVVSSGRLCYQKAPWRFFELAESLKDTGARFLWIGDGEVLSEDGGRQPIPSNVEITGWMDRPRVMELLAGAEVYTLLSLWEGMPLVLIEAQAIGLPAVIADTPGSRDVVQDGITGFVCRDKATWTEAVRRLVDDTLLCRAMGQKASLLAGQRFSVHRQCEATMRAYVDGM